MENELHKTAKRLGSMWKASRQLQVGLILFLVVLLIAILANVLSPYDPYYLGDDLLVPPGSEGHPLGTNQMGCDILSMILHGSRASLTIGIVSALISGLIGTLLGAFAGYYGGVLDKITLNEKEIFGIIGESGCGKSTLGRLLIRLEEPTSGEIEFYGVSTKKLLDCNPEQFHCLVQSVFQNPFDTFTPNDTIGAIMERPLKLHHIGETDEERRKICVDALNEGGLIPAESFLERYPHELSGGQLQRISILRSMLLKPTFLVVDEPVSMLDVSVRADIINMLLKLVENHNTSILFISHDISIIRYVSARVAVMYLGNIVEMGETDTIIHHPLHPYTQALISNCASIDLDEKREPIRIEGEPPSPVDPKPCCPFAGRCFCEQEICRREKPQLRQMADGRVVACHLVKEK